MPEMLKSLVLLIAACACLIPATGTAQTMYRWRDSTGWHYSEICPAGQTCVTTNAAPRPKYLPSWSGDTTTSTSTTITGTSTDSGSTTSTTSGGTTTSTSTTTTGTSTDSGSTTPTATSTASGGTISGGSGGSRPAYNTGVGFFVGDDHKLYDPNGVAFRIRGFNEIFTWNPHPGVSIAKPSAVRLNTFFGLAQDPLGGHFCPPFLSCAGKLLDVWNSELLANSIVPIASTWGHGVTGSTSTSTLNAAVADWVAYASTFKPYERYMIINIANEWGPGDTNDKTDLPYGGGGTDTNGEAWAAAYRTAITNMRNAGYLGTLMIDCGEYGKSYHDIIDQGQALLDFDPQHNLIFSVHLYDYAAQSPTQLATMFSALNATGLPYVVGEFGPKGLNGSNATPLEIMTAAENAGVGWMAWAWDDYHGSTYCVDDGTWFALVKQYCNVGYSGSSSELTIYGNTVIKDPTYGLETLNTPKATIFP